MPPEPLPWDRKDFVFKDRKHDRITSCDAIASSTFGSGGNSTPRWRDPYHFPRASPRRPPPSYHRQNGSYSKLYDDSNGHGCTPSRSDDGFRSSNGRYNGGRSSGRESRGSFRRSPYWEGYEPSHVTSQRSVAVPITSPPPPPLKDDKNSSGDDQRSDRDCGRDQDNSLGSIGWKPLKWSRQGSFSSSKALRSEVEEASSGSLEVLVPNLGKETPVRSPVSSPVPLDDGVPKKKPRLTWGQGLAKYEKQKVEGSSNSGKDQASESSPKVMGMAGSRSPATPCSVACHSPGTEERPFSKLTNDDTSHLSQTSALGLQNCSEELTIKLDQLPPISTLSSLLNDLLQPEDACTGDSTSARYTCTNKLLLFKADISKELEKTECEIDLLENELKSLNNNGRSDPGQILQADSSVTFCLESAVVLSKVSSNSTSVISSAVNKVGGLLMPIYSSGDEVKLAHNDVPQTTSSNNVELVPSGDEPMTLDHEERAVTENGSRDSSQLDAGSSDAVVNLDMISYEKRNSNLIDLIMASNREAAKRASHIFDGALSIAQQQSDIWGSDKFLSWRKNDKHIREKLAMQKNQLKFKERVLTLKFRAFHHLWKEDLRLLSVRKQRPKLQKRFELCSRSSQSSSQKNRSSIRSRFTLPAGNLTLVPTADIVDFTSRLLSDSQIKLYRKNLKMPALVLDEKERRYSRFVTNNNLLEDPPTFEKERLLINPWTQKEKGVFMDMLATYGKDFAKISSFLSHKTTADCIEFYYKNHKSESFRDVKKQLDLRKQCRLSTNTYLVTSGKKGHREANAASLDMLGAVSVAMAHNNGNARNHQKYAGRSVVPSYHSTKVSHGSCSSSERVSSIEISGYEKETAGTNVLTSGYGALSSVAVSSSITSSVSPPEKMNYARTDRPSTPEVTQTIEEEDTCSEEGCGELDSVDWTDEEKTMFIRALSLYGKDFTRVSDCVGTKSRDQCKIFFSKARKCLSLDQFRPGPGNGSTPVSDANGGRSDTDDACAAEMDSAICSTQSCSRMDVDFTQSVTNIGVEGFIHVGNTSLQTENDRSSEQYELGGSNQEEVDGKVGGLESALNVEKLETERENLQSKRVQGMGDAVLKHTELVPSRDVVKLLVDRELGRVENGISAYAVEPSTASCTEDEKMKIQTPANVPQGVFPEGRAAAVGLKSEVELQQFPVVTESGSGERQKKIDADKRNSANFSYAAESIVEESDSYISRKVTVCPTRTSNFSTYEPPMPLELLACSQKKSQMSSKQDCAYSAPLSTMLPDPSSISSESSFRVPSESTFNFSELPHKLHQRSATKDLYQQCLSRINLNQIDLSSHVSSGYPVQTLNQKESKREENIISEKPILSESHSIGNLSSQLNRYVVPDADNEDMESLVASNSRPGMLFFQRNMDTSDSQLGPCSTNTCQEPDSQLGPCSTNTCQEPEEQQSTQRTGDVKLFGQILTNPSSQQKSNSSSQETDSQPCSPKQRQLATMKMSTGRKDVPSRCENIGQSSLEEVPLRSYGYWDGSRIQTGFSSLADPAVMLAAYQGSVAGTPFYSSKDSGVSSSNGVATNYQRAYAQPLSANGKRLDSFSDLQRRNGFELVSGFQQGGRTAMARLSGNMAGGSHGNMAGGSRGITVGGTGVSDPVAALKMAKLYSGEVESWTRDINGR